jgi:hypothetical protein
MMFLYMKTGECLEIEAAAKAERRNGVLVFLDRQGQMVQTIDSRLVEAYTADPDIIGALKEEVCEDVDTMPPAAAAK